MSGLIRNEITLYLRPIENIQPYQKNSCARWLMEKGFFSNYKSAILWLYKIEMSDIRKFKAIMSRYFEETDYAQDYLSSTNKSENLRKYRSSANNYYGEEYHMWF